MAIRWDKFTVKAQDAVQRSTELASEHGNPEMLPVHVLAALLEDKEGIVPPVLEKIGIGPQTVLNDVYREIERLPKVSGGARSSRPFPQPPISSWNAPSRKPAILRMSTFQQNTYCWRSPSRSRMPRARSCPVMAPPTTQF